MKAIYAIAYVEAWKPQDFKGAWTRDLAIPVRRSNQLSYEATDVGSWSFVSSKEPVRNECEVIYMKYFIHWTHKWSAPNGRSSHVLKLITWKPGWELNCLKRFQVQPLTTVIEKKTVWKTPGKFLMRERANNRQRRVMSSVPGFKNIIIISSAGLKIVANVDRECSLPFHDFHVPSLSSAQSLSTWIPPKFPFLPLLSETNLADSRAWRESCSRRARWIAYWHGCLQSSMQLGSWKQMATGAKK